MGFSSSSTEPDDDLNALCEINVTPFIDVMLVLLIIFMVAAPLSTSNVPLDLPSTTQVAQPEQQDPLLVSLQSDGSLHIRDVPVTREQFPQELLKASHNDRESRVMLRADKTVNYEALVKVMDLLRDNGYTKVALVGLVATAEAHSE